MHVGVQFISNACRDCLVCPIVQLTWYLVLKDPLLAELFPLPSDCQHLINYSLDPRRC